ncbi:MAG: dipeptidyl aminopeptidase [Acidobacteria bacterium]|nr:dipeptidyl aminopeptidase [Acidobacteriota bacterium]
MNRRIWIAILAAGLAAAKDPGTPWNLQELYKVPPVYSAPDTGEPGVRTLFIESVPYKGKATRVFAYYGAPEVQEGAKVPAMVLIHGGGGTAFAEWVRLWNKRGYAAIAMDTVGTIPKRGEGNKLWNPDRERHEHSGPAGWGDFNNVDLPPGDQWTYHAVAAAVKAHSLLRSFPEVDSKRTGVTGISWGGYLTSIVSGVDPRFRFAAPVYGCGFLGEDSAWLTQFEKLGKERAARWLSLWDPSVYLAHARMPMLWVNGTNDFAYPLPSWHKSLLLTKGRRTLAVRVRMKHSHPDGALPEDIHAYANAILRGGARPVRVLSMTRGGGEVAVRYKAAKPVVKAELNFTKDSGPWQKRNWESLPVEAGRGRLAAQLPSDATAYYVNLFDADGLVSSTEPVLGP